MLQIDKQAQDGVADVLKVIHNDPTLKIMWENMAPSNQTIMKRSLENSLKSTIQKAKGDKIQIKPNVKVIISYPENIYMTEPFLELDWGLEKIFIMRYSVDFEQQVRSAAQLRNIQILEFKTRKIVDAEPIETSPEQHSEEPDSTKVGDGTSGNGGEGTDIQGSELSLFEEPVNNPTDDGIGL